MNSTKTKLSHRQWLNIIIISISAMFLLMVIVSEKLNESVNQQTNPSQSSGSGKIQKIDFGGIAIYRAEKRWESLPQNATSIELAQTIGQSWQQLLSKSAKPIELPISTGRTVLLFFGDSNKPIVCKMTKRDQKLVFQFIESNLEFETDARYQHLFLPQ